MSDGRWSGQVDGVGVERSSLRESNRPAQTGAELGDVKN
jgi:hypothetical protein